MPARAAYSRIRGFAQWRQQIRLLSAISLLAEGRSITSVALDVGYESPSAFTATFHRAFGQPPSAYMGALSRVVSICDVT